MTIKRSFDSGEGGASPEPDRRRLKDLRNVGKAALADFAILGIETVQQLASCEPEELYQTLQTRTGTRHDPCVWDVFAATIHEARTGEARDWWKFTPDRKRRQAARS
jgi:hypothetical protein